LIKHPKKDEMQAVMNVTFLKADYDNKVAMP
jgi:tellurite resistance protein